MYFPPHAIFRLPSSKSLTYKVWQEGKNARHDILYLKKVHGLLSIAFRWQFGLGTWVSRTSLLRLLSYFDIRYRQTKKRFDSSKEYLRPRYIARSRIRLCAILIKLANSVLAVWFLKLPTKYGAIFSINTSVNRLTCEEWKWGQVISLWSYLVMIYLVGLSILPRKVVYIECCCFLCLH